MCGTVYLGDLNRDCLNTFKIRSEGKSSLQCFLCSSFFPYKKTFIYLKGRLSERKKERVEEGNFPPASSLPKWLRGPWLHQAESRCQELPLGLLEGGGGWSKHFGYVLLLAWVHQQGAMSEAGHWDLNLDSNMGCQCHRQCGNSLSHNTSLSFGVF